MKKVVYIAAIAILLITVFTFYLKRDFEKAPPTLFYNGNIITVNDEQPTAEAMLVVDGIIQSIGNLSSIDHEIVNGLVKRDLNGATVMPGFIDVHTHFALSMFLEEMHDLSGFTFKNNRQVWYKFEEVVKNAQADEWLVFKGIDPILIPDLIPPTLSYMDSIAPNNPVVIFSQSLHSYYANSKAFEKVGITADSKNPSEHSYYERDKNGQFTGLIVEQEAFKPFTEKLKDEVLTAQLLSKASEKVMHNYAQKGNTTIVSTGLTINDSKPLILMQHLSDSEPTLLGGFLQLIGQFPERQALPRHFMYMRHDMSHLMPEQRGEQNDFYDIIGIKHWLDGSPYTGSMYIDSTYLNTPLTTEKLGIPKGSRGEALVSRDKLKNFIRKYHANGWQIVLHTQGDAAVKEAIEAYAELQSELDFSNSRHRLEHCLMLPTSELNDIKKLNLTPSFHINHILFYGDALNSEILGEKRTSQLLPIHSAVDRGITVSLHADQPMFESKPFLLMQTAMLRQTKGGVTIGETEKIDLTSAIKALTINAAWQINMDNKLGSLENGKYADFIILDQNPYELAAENLDQVKCLETFINGNKVSY